jgi:carbonic anhydrase/acetyltransferase-like protein (isoleucine patch superfamily)
MPIILPFQGKRPEIHSTAYVADNATVIGDTVIGEESSIWFGTVVRADVMPIRVGKRSNIQDNSVVHVTTDIAGCTIGDEVTVGHRAILHACTIGNRVLVGMGAIVLDLAVVEDDVMIGAGSLVTPRTRLPSGYLCMGSPTRPIRPLKDIEREMIRLGWVSYQSLSKQYASEK